MDDSDSHLNFIFNKEKMLENTLIVLAILSVLIFMYLEKVKNFERFNINGKDRDAVIAILCFIQGFLLTYVICFAGKLY